MSELDEHEQQPPSAPDAADASPDGEAREPVSPGPDGDGEAAPASQAEGFSAGAADSADLDAADTEAQDEPAALVADGTEKPFVERRRGERRIRTVDFSQPTKFTAELRRRIVRLLGPFTEAYASRLSSELRAPVELALADASQLTWSAAKAGMPASTIAVALEVQPVERRMLLGVDPPMILRALECLLGGKASDAPSQRRFSEIDWALTTRLLESMTIHLTAAWRDLGGQQLVLGEVDLEGDAGVVYPLGEPTFAVAFDCRIDGLHSRMSLLIPWSAVKPVADEMLGGSARAEDADPQEGHAMQRGLSASPVQLRAEVGSAPMPVERMLALTPGTVLSLEDRADNGVQLFAEGVPIGRACPGLRGARRAVKLNAPIEPGPALAMRAAKASKPSTQTVPVGAEDSRDGEPADAEPTDDEAKSVPPTTRDSLARMLGVSVRVWAELGRTTVPLGSTLELPPGTVIELDQGAEAPIELFVNGMCFAFGTLQVTAEGDWAVQVDALV